MTSISRGRAGISGSPITRCGRPCVRWNGRRTALDSRSVCRSGTTPPGGRIGSERELSAQAGGRPRGTCSRGCSISPTHSSCRRKTWHSSPPWLRRRRPNDVGVARGGHRDRGVAPPVPSATTPQDYRAVGNDCVHIMEALSQQVYDHARRTPAGEEPVFSRDTPPLSRRRTGRLAHAFWMGTFAWRPRRDAEEA
jgi:hypothetical protein